MDWSNTTALVNTRAMVLQDIIQNAVGKKKKIHAYVTTYSIFQLLSRLLLLGYEPSIWKKVEFPTPRDVLDQDSLLLLHGKVLRLPLTFCISLLSPLGVRWSFCLYKSKICFLNLWCVFEIGSQLFGWILLKLVIICIWLFSILSVSTYLWWCLT